MKISLKIILLVVLLLCLLAVDGLIGYNLLKRMGAELKGVVNKDVALMQDATAITRHQLEKAVIFERVRRISEELAYQQTTPQRREHLLFYIKLAKGNFRELADRGALNIVNAKQLIDENKKSGGLDKVARVEEVLKEIERAHIHYDVLIEDIFAAIDRGLYEISQEQLSQVQRDEKKLSTELDKLIEAVQQFTRGSLAVSERYESTAERILWAALLISLLIGTVLAFSIIRKITRQLGVLVAAARRVGEGDLESHLDEGSKDEFGDLSIAFNNMSRQLALSRKQLQEQSVALKLNLDVMGQQKKDLEKINRELDRFVHTVSHDIRSPLMGISWYADFLKKQQYPVLDGKGRESVEGVIRGVDRANALISDLLALTRLSRIRNPYEYVQTAALLEDVLATLEYKIREKKVDLRVQPNMPAIIGDAIKLREVFLNLINNAIKFSSGDAHVQPVVEIAYKDALDSHEFSIKDNGIGIEPQYHEEIFAIFKRLDTSDKFEGTGAGLSIVKSIVEDHGGKVWVESELGKGAVFHFSIPKVLEINHPPTGEPE